LRSASVDLKGGTVTSSEPVVVRLPDATVEADGLNIRDSGKIITFIGNVKTVINPGASEARANASADPAQEGVARTSQAAPLSLRP
jgi:lipopolysaccharide export system protein LptC